MYRFAYTCECVYAFLGSAVLPKIGLFVDYFGTFDLMYAYTVFYTQINTNIQKYFISVCTCTNIQLSTL